MSFWQDIKDQFAAARDGWKWARRRYVALVIAHPLLLIAAFPLYLFLSFIAIFVSIIIILGTVYPLTKLFGASQEVANGVAQFFFQIVFAMLILVVWSHYIYLTLRSVVTAAPIAGYLLPILRVVQLVGTTVFIFAVAHYYIALFSDSEHEAYHGLRRVFSEPYMRAFGNEWDDLSRVPTFEMALDCIYYSTITTATVGYGDIYPVSNAAKIATVIQVIFSFGLVVVLLGWVVGNSDKFSQSPKKQGEAAVPPS
jgi:hypothetical protein